MSHWNIEKAEFDKIWQKTKGEKVTGTFKLNYASKQAAIQELMKKYGITKIYEEEVQNSNKVTLQLAGKYLGNFKTLMTLVVGFDTKLGCVVKITVLSEKEDLGQELVDALE